MTLPARPAYRDDPDPHSRSTPQSPVDLLEAPSAPPRLPPAAPHTPAGVGTRDQSVPRRGGGPRGPRGIDPRPGQIPGLDGIRALAILGVLVYHFTPALLPGGFLGVDVFFVVSGFLITTLLMRELAQRGRDRPAPLLAEACAPAAAGPGHRGGAQCRGGPARRR